MDYTGDNDAAAPGKEPFADLIGGLDTDFTEQFREEWDKLPVEFLAHCEKVLDRVRDAQVVVDECDGDDVKRAYSLEDCLKCVKPLQIANRRSVVSSKFKFMLTKWQEASEEECDDSKDDAVGPLIPLLFALECRMQGEEFDRRLTGFDRRQVPHVNVRNFLLGDGSHGGLLSVLKDRAVDRKGSDEYTALRAALEVKPATDPASDAKHKHAAHTDAAPKKNRNTPAKEPTHGDDATHDDMDTSTTPSQPASVAKKRRAKRSTGTKTKRSKRPVEVDSSPPSDDSESDDEQPQQRSSKKPRTHIGIATDNAHTIHTQANTISSLNDQLHQCREDLDRCKDDLAKMKQKNASVRTRAEELLRYEEEDIDVLRRFMEDIVGLDEMSQGF